MRVSSTARTALLMSTIACLCALLLLSGILYMINRSSVKLHEAELSSRTREEEARQFTQLEKLANETVDSRNEIEQYILEQSEFIEFLSLLERTASGAGVEVETKSISASDTKGEFNAVTIDLELGGSFKAIERVIDLYEHLPYQSHIAGASFDRSESEVDQWRAHVTLMVTQVTL